MSFDGLAPFYTSLELVLAGNTLQRCRLAWLDQVPVAGNILLVGEGRGRFLKACVSRFPGSQITCVDASLRMLELAERRFRSARGDGTCRFVQAELPAWAPPTAQFDLIVSHFFLDCFVPEVLTQVVATLARAAAPGAAWLISDFAVPASGWRRWRARSFLALAYFFFRRVTGLQARCITPPDVALRQVGFRLQQRRWMEWGLLQADCWTREDGSGSA